MKIPVRSALLTVAAASLIGVAGCSKNSASSDVSYAAITGNLSPELAGLAERPIDRDRNLKNSMQLELRMLNDDIYRAMYWDHPSRLTPYPIPYTSGEPR